MCLFPRVSRRADADPLIEELHVGDAAEPQGRGTGHIVLSFILKMLKPQVNICDTSAPPLYYEWGDQRHGCQTKHLREVDLLAGAVKAVCCGQAARWQISTGTDSWTCCWLMERAPSSPSLSSRSHRCVSLSLSLSKCVCILNCITSSGLV